MYAFPEPPPPKKFQAIFGNPPPRKLELGHYLFGLRSGIGTADPGVFGVPDSEYAHQKPGPVQIRPV